MRPQRLCYSGTAIPLIRGGAPDPAPEPKAAPAGGPADKPPTLDTPPARNWEKDYGELEARHKRYETLRHPAENRALTAQEIEQALTWGKTVYQQIQSGELLPKSSMKPAAPAAPATDPYERWEELEPRQQAALLRSEMDARATDARKQIEEPLSKRFDEFQRNQAQQQQLLLKVIQQMIKEPSLDPTDVLTRATELAALPPEKLLERAVEMVTEPQRRERDIKQGVAAELARLKQEEENKQVAILSARPGPHLVPRKESGTRGDRLGSAFTNMLRKADELNRTGS